MAPPSNTVALRIIVGTFVVLGLATWITMSTVKIPMQMMLPVNLAATPLGYTFSLSLVLLPFFVLLYWYIKYPHGHKSQWPCFLRTVLILFVVWSLLDFIFAGTIFYFPNHGAVLGLWFPGFVPGYGLYPAAFPIEEFVFYLFACLLILMIYIWSSEVWFDPPFPSAAAHASAGAGVIPIVDINWSSIVLGVVLVLLAYIYQQSSLYTFPGPPASLPPGNPTAPPTGFSGSPVFPVYFTLLVIIVIVPAAFLYNRMKQFINTGALLMTMLITTLVSIIWEATLALPYGWWGYQPDFMVGIFVPAWFNLPFESVILWIASSWSLIFIYELERLSCLTGLSVWAVMSGKNAQIPNAPGGNLPGSNSATIAEQTQHKEGKEEKQ